MTAKPKISIIIPIYNVEKYLRRCLESVCNQSLPDIEIICVDDGSTDTSAQIAEQYAQNYQNLKLIYLEKNQGVSAARNAGLVVAQGEYIAFLDSDDEIDLDFYEKLYSKAKAENCDIVKGQAIEITYDGHKNFVKQIGENNKFLFLTYWLIAIYKRSLITENNISFSTDHALGEDLLFLNRALIAAKSLQLVDGTYYYYHRRQDSKDAKILSEEKITSALDVYEKIIDNINANIPASDFIYYFLFHHFIMSCFYLSLKNSDEKVKKICAGKTAAIFEKCQNPDGLESFFTKTAPHLFTLLKNRDLVGVENVLIKCKSIMEIIAMGLRTRIQNK